MAGLEGPQSQTPAEEPKQGYFGFEPGFVDSSIPEKEFDEYTISERAELIRITTGVDKDNLSPKLRRFRQEYAKRREEEINDDHYSYGK